MIADFLDYFKSAEFDENIIIKNHNKSYSVYDIKKLVYAQAKYLKNIKEKNVTFAGEENFDFIINLLACIFAKKTLYIASANCTEQQSDVFVITKLAEEINGEVLEFENIDPRKSDIFLTTSGSTNEPKLIHKTLAEYLKESEDLKSTFEFEKGLEFVSTTTLNHLFGQTFHLFLPLNNGNVINTTRINYPEEVNAKKSVLVTTPSFLAVMNKYDYTPAFFPEKIISAGARLENKTFEYARRITNQVIDIYGSTETGVIAYRHDENSDAILFKGIKILSSEENSTQIASDYSINQIDVLQDRIVELENRRIKLLGRSDKVFKIQEKRISAIEIEEKLSSLPFVQECWCTVKNDKLAMLTVLTPEGMEKFIKLGKIELVKELKSFLAKNFKVVPQYWAFIDELPKNKNSKVDKKAIEKIFSLNLSLPLIVKRYTEKDYAEFDLFFYRGCNFYKGHFEGCPITPGVVQLFYANYLANSVFDLDCHEGMIRRIKFKNIIYPDSLVKLKIKKTPSCVEYEYSDENKIYSSGALPVKNFLK